MAQPFRTRLAVCTAVTLSLPVQAGMLGVHFAWQYYAYGGPYTEDPSSSGAFTVTGGVGGTFEADSGHIYFNIVADDTSITFDYSVTNFISTCSLSDLSLAPTIHNGIAIDLVAGSPFLFSSVNIDPLTNMVGFDATRFSFTASQIQVDGQNLSWDTNTKVKLDVGTVPNTIPEPSTLTLFGVALLGLGAWSHRHQVKRSHL